MGAVHFSIDVSLVENLKRSLPLEVFVETGTFKGDGVRLVRAFFQELYTVESSAEYYESALKLFSADPSVHVFHETSTEFLRRMAPRFAGQSVLYWLDAHWCGAETDTDIVQCPLLEELAAIGHLNERSVVLIDDARLFLSPPPPPHNPEQWPSLDLVIRALHALSTAHEILVLNDVFVCFPRFIGNDLRAFASRCTINWLTVLDKARDYDAVARSAREKEAEIESLACKAREKDVAIESLVLEARGKDIEIQNLAKHAAEKELEIQRQHTDILRLLQEASALRHSNSYRLGFALLNPWSCINQKLLKRSE